MLRKLVKLFERSHNTSPFPIIISYAGLPALYQEDIEDAAEYLKLRTLRSYYVYPPQEMVAAYAGYGMGLCEDYTNRTNCRQEEKGLPTREVLLVEYTEAALLLQCQTLRDAHPLGESYLYISASFELGSGNSAERGDTSKIRTLVMQLLRKRYHTFRLPSKDITIIMTGSPKSVEDSEARRVIKDAAETFGFEVNILSTNPEYIAARGAAELAWRELILSKQKELWLGVSGDN
jgi:hypothetical protein